MNKKGSTVRQINKIRYTAAYLILGAGKQGVAAAYDVIRFGHAARVTLADTSPVYAQAAVRKLRRIAGSALKKNKIVLTATSFNARKDTDLRRVMQGHDAVLSALPYYLNPAVARAAIASKIHYCDLGGYFEATQDIMKLDAQARKAGVTLVPDCGVAPGMCNSLAVCGMDRLTQAKDVKMYCGGLPQKPKPPLGYKVVFNLEGVLGNYFGKSYVLREGKVQLVPSFSGREEIQFGRFGRLEAVITGGATSTCPWTFQKTLRNYDYKTLRYPGHYDKIQMLKDLGLLETAKIQVNGSRVSPREVFVAVSGPKLAFPKDRDLLIQRVVVYGTLKGKKAEVTYDVLDYGDARTDFTAMQRTTGFSAAIVLEMLAQNAVPMTGFVPVEKAIPGALFLKEIRRRGIDVKERIRVEQA
jgi:lysine 6-dehydrogenase